jgi:predicted transcriptional regulator
MPKFVMSDGRQFTDWTPSCDLNGKLQKQFEVGNSHEYRYVLQKNAEKIIKQMVPSEEMVLCPVCKKALNV